MDEDTHFQRANSGPLKIQESWRRQQTKGVITITKATRFITRVGRLSKAEENCAVVAICHSYYINSVVYLS